MLPKVTSSGVLMEAEGRGTTLISDVAPWRTKSRYFDRRRTRSSSKY
jgi:hypothetical protein